MRTRYLLFVLLIPLFYSCGSKTIFKENTKFDNLQWNRFKELSFSWDVKDTSAVYDVVFNLRHHTVYPYDNLFITIALYSPSGERRVSDFHIPVKNPDGSFKAEGMGDYWDLDYVLFPDQKFREPGKYKIEIENRMDKLETPGIMEAGVTIRKK
jgi:gliding motility-associated lipoprotein GldH